MRSASVWHTAGQAAQATHAPGRIFSRHPAEAVRTRETSNFSAGPVPGRVRRGSWGPPPYHNIRLAFQSSDGVVLTAVRNRSA